MTHPERTPDPIVDLLRQDAHLDDQTAAAARAQFLSRVDDELAKAPTVSRKVWIAPLALAAAVALAWLVWPQGTLTYDVAGAEDEGGYIRSPAGAPATVLFTDATTVRAEPGARLRVVETTKEGARVLLEEGTVDVHVTHTGSSRWNFEAGPFNVHVTGTRFDLAWDRATETLRLDLYEGSVEVSGAESAGPMPVRAGQRFVGRAQTRTIEVGEMPRANASPRPDPANTKGSPSSVQPEPGDDAGKVDAGSSEEESSLPHAKGAAKASDSWSKLVSKGAFPEVVAAAEKQGVDACLASCGSADLQALADAARYTGKNSLAESALKALRARHAGSSGTKAAFLLGRLYEGQGNVVAARAWYETVLRESPSGTYAGEALAGRMRTALALQGRSAAQPIARDYLKRYPDGVHAAAAKKIAEP